MSRRPSRPARGRVATWAVASAVVGALLVAPSTPAGASPATADLPPLPAAGAVQPRRHARREAAVGRLRRPRGDPRGRAAVHRQRHRHHADPGRRGASRRRHRVDVHPRRHRRDRAGARHPGGDHRRGRRRSRPPCRPRSPRAWPVPTTQSLALRALDADGSRRLPRRRRRLRGRHPARARQRPAPEELVRVLGRLGQARRRPTRRGSSSPTRRAGRSRALGSSSRRPAAPSFRKATGPGTPHDRRPHDHLAPARASQGPTADRSRWSPAGPPRPSSCRPIVWRDLSTRAS